MPTASIDQLATLLRYCEDFAKQMLGEAGEFHPFGAFLNGEGKVEALSAYLGGQLQEHELYSLLQGAVSSLAAQGKLKAYAIAANVNIPSQLEAAYPDGIRVHVESPGYSRMVYTPYQLLSYRPLRKFLAFLPLVEYLEPIAVDVNGSAFLPPAG